MKSPFPGMDPYLEARWSGVQQRLITYIADELNQTIPVGLRAEVHERVYVEYPDTPRRRDAYPDVYVRPVQVRPVPSDPLRSATGGIAVDKPIVLSLAFDPVTEPSIEIIDGSDGERVVTAIELLSPKNKRRGEGRRAYRATRRTYLRGGVNLVEIDLLRAGRRMNEMPEGVIPPDRRCDYLVTVIRTALPTPSESLYPISLRERLPKFHLPLRPRDEEAVIELQPLFDRIYSGGRYGIDYSQPARPPLSPADAEWAAAMAG